MLLAGNLAENISKALFSGEQSYESIADFFLAGLPSLVSGILKVLFAILIFLIGQKIIKALKNPITKGLGKTSLDTGVRQFFSQIIGAIFYIFLILLILGVFGIGTGSVVAIVGSAGLSAGLALQGSLSNFAGGVLILILKPFRVGDYIKEDTHGNIGRVKEITLCYTKLITAQQNTVVLPNGALSNCSLTNFTKDNRVILNLSMNVAFSSDIQLIKNEVIAMLEKDPSRIRNLDVTSMVTDLATNGVTLNFQICIPADDYWDAKYRILENMNQLIQKGIIVLPGRVVTVRIEQPSK